MARLQDDGSILMNDGGLHLPQQVVIAADLCELVEALCPRDERLNYAGAGGGSGFGAGGRGVPGARGPQGSEGPPVQGPQGPQGPGGGGGDSGWTDDGAVVRLTTSTDQVVIGGAVPFGTEKLLVIGDLRVSGGEFLGDAGSAASPTYSFALDPNTGLYNSGSDEVSISLGSTQRLIFTQSVGRPQLRVDGGAPGDQLNPTFTFMFDEDTGMYREAVNTLGFAAGGIESFRVTTTGATVFGKLTVTGSIDPTDITMSGGGTAHWMQWGPGSTAPVSAVGTARIRYNQVANQFEQSLSGAAYVAFGGGTSFPLYAPDGTAALPSYSFMNDNGAGMYLDGAGRTAFADNGVSVLALDGATQQILAEGTGSAASPTYSFTFQSDSGMYFSGDLFLASGGTDILRLHSATFQTILMQAGSAAVPSLTFDAGSNDDGFYAVGGGIGVSGDGVEVAQFTTSGGGDPQILAADGSAAAPSIAFISKTNTGIYLNGGGKMELVDEATPMFRVTGSTEQLFALKDGSVASPVWSFSSDPSLGMYRNLSGDLGFTTVGGETFTVHAAGATVTGKLTVTGSIDPTDITLSGGGTAHWQQWGAGSTAPVSAVGTGRIRYHEGLNQFQQSLSGAAYTAFGGVTFPLLAPNGTSVAPSYSFASDSNAGMYFDTAAPHNGVAISDTGGSRHTVFHGLGGTAQVRGPSGAAANPAYSFTADSDSGMYSAGADVIRLAAGGVNALQVSSTAVNVITLPFSADIMLASLAGTAATPRFTFVGDSNTGIFNPGADILGFAAGGTETFRVTTTGPVALLDRGYRATGQVSSAGANLGTLTNSPTLGDPAFWLRVNINGTNHAIPAWLG